MLFMLSCRRLHSCRVTGVYWRPVAQTNPPPPVDNDLHALLRDAVPHLASVCMRETGDRLWHYTRS